MVKNLFSKTFLLLVCLIIIPAFMSGCGLQTQNPTDQAFPNEVQVTESGGACGSEVGLSAGDILVLILDRDPSEAYVWEVGFYVPQVIMPENDIVSQQDSDMDNTSGSQTFRFKAIGEGQVDLRMIYHDPSESGSSVLKTCEVKVYVK